jgi:HlyD family secretion protein
VAAARAAPNPASPAVALLVVAALVGCSGQREHAAFAGYAEAELIYLSAGAAGTLRSLQVKRGDPVQAGQELAALDTDAEVLNRTAAEARRERASALQRNLQKGRRPNELRAIEQQLAQAEAALAGSRAVLDRNKKLVEQGYLAPLRLEEFVAAHDRDQAHVRELQAQRALALEAARADEIAAAAAEARASTADVALARWREGQKLITAPVGARVFDVMYRAGEWVNAGAPVLSLLAPGAIKVRFFVPETALSSLSVGTNVNIRCDGCPEGPQGMTARVRWIAPQAEYTPPVIYSVGSRSKLVFMVEAEPAAGSTLKPGQPVDVRLATPSR